MLPTKDSAVGVKGTHKLNPATHQGQARRVAATGGATKSAHTTHNAMAHVLDSMNMRTSSILVS